MMVDPTTSLLSSEENAKRLLEAVQDVHEGNVIYREPLTDAISRTIVDEGYDTSTQSTTPSPAAPQLPLQDDFEAWQRDQETISGGFPIGFIQHYRAQEKAAKEMYWRNFAAIVAMSVAEEQGRALTFVETWDVLNALKGTDLPYPPQYLRRDPSNDGGRS